ncbi:MAG: YeeE/YedE family protein [Gallionellaceae bacterium]|nr:MAG: YeeE/YedE family protein [Gallionellaceae bacterium]
MNSFSMVQSLLGGMLIGISAALLLWLTGHIAGVSGIVGRLLFAIKNSDEIIWRALFLIGLVVGAKLYYLGFAAAPAGRDYFPAWLLIVSGLLVGFGTSLGNGCTSGHGVCGLGRLSVRSLIATLIFLGVAILTTYLVRHLFGLGVANG